MPPSGAINIETSAGLPRAGMHALAVPQSGRCVHEERMACALEMRDAAERVMRVGMGGVSVGGAMRHGRNRALRK